MRIKNKKNSKACISIIIILALLPVIPTLSANTGGPIVEVLSPNGGEVWSGIQTISWIANHSNPNQNLSITIQLGVQHPNVTYWQNIPQLTNISNTGSIEVNTNAVPDHNLYLIRIIAKDEDENEANATLDTVFTIANEVYPRILTNQVGFRPEQPKTAVLELLLGETLTEPTVELIDEANNEIAWTGEATYLGDYWGPYFRAYYKVDFSEFKISGKYHLRCQGVDSFSFEIAESFETEPWHLASDVYFPVAMCGIGVELNGFLWHEACHTHDARQAEVGEMVWGGGGPGYGGQHVILQQEPIFEPNENIDTTGGWHDAGDYNKYMGTTPWVLVALGLTIEEFNPDRDVYTVDTEVGYVYSGANGKPDLMEQLAWGLRYTFKMQQDDYFLVDYGSIFERIFSGHDYWGLPENEEAWRGQERPIDTDRWTEHAAEFACAAAIASRVLQDYDPNLANEALNRAEMAWEWIELNPNRFCNTPYHQYYGLHTNAFLAAVELYITTGKDVYWQYIIDHLAGVFTRSSGYAGWPTVELARLYLKTGDPYVRNQIKNKLDGFLQVLTVRENECPFTVSPQFSGFGNNDRNMGTAFDLYWISKAYDDETIRQKMYPYLDWILGRNPAGYSFMSGVGTRFPLHPLSNLAQNHPELGQGEEWIPGGIVPGIVRYPPGLIAYKDKPISTYTMSEYCIYYTPVFIFDALALDSKNFISGAAPKEDTMQNGEDKSSLNPVIKRIFINDILMKLYSAAMRKFEEERVDNIHLFLSKLNKLINIINTKK